MMLHQQQDKLLAETDLTGDNFDLVIVGAGVVGCAIARRFALEGAKICIVEKASDILDGASKANSAILHTGFDAPENSIELSCIKAGYQEYLQIHKDLGLPIETTRAHVVAWNENEAAKLDDILAQAHANGIKNTQIISNKQLANSEPNLADHAKSAIIIPDEAIIDPWSAPYAYLRQALENTAKVFLSCQVIGGEFNSGQWHLKTSRGRLKTKYVINCAGLYGDKLDEDLLGKTKFNITPRKGQFVVFDKAASALINSIILPVPTAKTKGVVICKTIFGNLLVGPTAEDQTSRFDASTDEESLKGLIAAGVKKLPLLKNMPVIATYAGLRPATQFKEYQINVTANKNWISVGGIRSTGLSSALGIAKHIFAEYSSLGQKHQKIQNPKLPEKSPILAENEQRDYMQSQHGKIICHCEMVSEREIQKALNGALKANSLAGLKRQTRVTMGRCQGFYCTAKLAALTRKHFNNPLAEKQSDE